MSAGNIDKYNDKHSAKGLQTKNLPETKEDIVWIQHKCEVCEGITNHLKGSEPHCIACAYNEANSTIPKEVVEKFVGIDEIRREGTYCLQDCFPGTTDKETLYKIKKECADLGCNVCLSETSNDIIEWPAHYNQGKIQPIDVIEDWNLDFRLSNTIKYIARAGKKDKTKTKQDLEKAIWYIRRFIEKEL